MTGGVRRLVPLTFGWVHLAETVSIHGGDPTRRLREPVPGVLCEVDTGWILLDTGFNDPLIRDRQLRRRFHDAGVEPELPSEEGNCLEWAFQQVGVAVSDVVAVAVSHLHYDHAGGLRHFAGRVPVYCQRREFDYALADPVRAEANGIYRIDFDDPAIDWRLGEGDVQLAPGLKAIPTYGHTPGHQSFVVDLDPEGQRRHGVPGFVFAFDAADLARNLDEEIAVGGLIDASPEHSVEVIRRLKALAANQGYSLIPGHDPVVWPALTHQLGAGPAHAAT